MHCNYTPRIADECVGALAIECGVTHRWWWWWWWRPAKSPYHKRAFAYIRLSAHLVVPKTYSPIKPHNNACDPVPKTIARGRAQSGGDKPPTIEYSSPTFDICVGATLVLCIILRAADILGSPAPVFRCPNWIGYVSCTHVRSHARTHARQQRENARRKIDVRESKTQTHTHARAQRCTLIQSTVRARVSVRVRAGARSRVCVKVCDAPATGTISR